MLRCAFHTHPIASRLSGGDHSSSSRAAKSALDRDVTGLPTGPPMLNAHDEVERLLDQIRAISPSQAVELASNQISALCGAYMEEIEELPGREYNLSPGEAKVLALLLRKRGKIVSREALFTASALNEETEIKTIDVRICKLRQKLPADKYKIETIWATGFRLAA